MTPAALRFTWMPKWLADLLVDLHPEMRTMPGDAFVLPSPTKPGWPRANIDRGLSAFDVSGKRAVAWWTRQFEDETVIHITTTDTHIFVVTDKSNVHAFAADKR